MKPDWWMIRRIIWWTWPFLALSILNVFVLSGGSPQ